MKYRQGFVANSSSSSFVLVFNKAPESFEDVHKTMFPGGPCRINHPYEDMLSYTSAEIAETVWNDIKGQKPKTPEEVREEYNNGYIGGEPKLPESIYRLNGKAWSKAYDKHEAEVNEYHAKVSSAFLSKHHGVYHIVEYCDNDGTYQTFMEHGDVFRNMPHQRISKH